jgi:hypothetical protein
MLELFPEINKQIERLNEIKENPEAWKETEDLNKLLVEND